MSGDDAMEVDSTPRPVGTEPQRETAMRTVEQLNSDDAGSVQSAVRRIKNATIGNRTQKAIFLRLQVVPRLLQLLSAPGVPSSTRVEAAVAIGSIASGGRENTEAVISHGAVLKLLEAVESPDAALVEASLRSLKFIVNNSPTMEVNIPRASFFSLVRLLDRTVASDNIIELAAASLSHAFSSGEMRDMFLSLNGLDTLLSLIYSQNARLQEAAVDVLASLTDHPGTELPRKLISRPPHDASSPVDILLGLIKDSRPRMRLLAATCLTNVSRSGVLDDSSATSMVQRVLPALIRLFDETGLVQERAPYVLAHLVIDNESLQKAACAADAVEKLSIFIRDANGTTSIRLKENALFAIAALSQSEDNCRMRVVEAGLVPFMAAALSSEEASIREAACQCFRSLSRSVKLLRSALSDVDLATPLIAMMDDSSLEVKVAACAVLCNVTLYFSPLKSALLASNCLAKLVEHSRSADHALRLNALWALKNTAYGGDTASKERVLQHLTYDGLYDLLLDREMFVQEQALSLLQNLAAEVKKEDVCRIFEGVGTERLLAVIAEKLASGVPELEHQAMYVLVNLGTGADQHLNAIIADKRIIELVKRFLGHPMAGHRLAAVWCVINLTWQDDDTSAWRVDQLKQVGVEERLREMVADENRDVAERVLTALENFGVSSA